MLEILTKHKTTRVPLLRRIARLAFEPPASEDDELIQDIESSTEETWQLEPVLDSEGLQEYFTDVLESDDLEDIIDFVKEDV